MIDLTVHAMCRMRHPVPCILPRLAITTRSVACHGSGFMMYARPRSLSVRWRIKKMRLGHDQTPINNSSPGLQHTNQFINEVFLKTVMR